MTGDILVGEKKILCSPSNKKPLPQGPFTDKLHQTEDNTPTPTTMHATETPKIHKLKGDISPQNLKPAPQIKPKVPVVKLENIQFNQNYRKPQLEPLKLPSQPKIETPSQD